MTSKAFGLAQLGNAYADGALSNRNLIINGAMQVAQRGTSVTGITGVGYYTADRVRTSFTQAAGAVLSQSVVPNQNVGDFIANALKNEVTTPAAGGACGFNYRVEVSDVAPHVGKTMTLSFYAKADASVDILPLIIGDTVVSPSTITLTTSYQRYVITFTMPSVSTVPHLDLILRADATVATANYITGVQLEAGDTATPFEHRSYGAELALCQRYYWKLYAPTNNGYVNGWSSTTQQRGILHFPVTMRAAPTFGSSAASSFFIQTFNSNFTPTAAPAPAGGPGLDSVYLATNATGLTGGQGAHLIDQTGSSFMEFSAEL